MAHKKFLVPVGVAVAALISNVSYSAQPPLEAKEMPLREGASTDAGKEPSDVVLQRLSYQLGAEKHALLLHKPASGIVYAQHYSHSSHGSHRSHRSHRSGF